LQEAAPSAPGITAEIQKAFTNEFTHARCCPRFAAETVIIFEHCGGD
jgi:hypothetical protein